VIFGSEENMSELSEYAIFLCLRDVLCTGNVIIVALNAGIIAAIAAYI